MDVGALLERHGVVAVIGLLLALQLGRLMLAMVMWLPAIYFRLGRVLQALGVPRGRDSDPPPLPPRQDDRVDGDLVDTDPQTPSTLRQRARRRSIVDRLFPRLPTVGPDDD